MILIDGSAILHRAWHVYDLKTSRGEPTNIIYGFLKILVGMSKLLPRDDYTVFWDRGRSRYRSERYAEYKRTPGRQAGRQKAGYPDGSFDAQLATLWDFCRALGLRQVGVQHVEADDCIAIACASVQNAVIASDDFDLWQLIGRNGARMFAPRKELWVETPAKCVELEGIWPQQIADYKALAGDPSDNIPGVQGVGDVKAKALLTLYGSLPGVYEAIRTGQRSAVLTDKLAEKLLAEEERAKLWFDICQPLTWDMLAPPEQAAYLSGWQQQPQVNRADLVVLLDRWELKSLRKDLEGLVGAFHDEPATPAEEAAPAQHVGEPVRQPMGRAAAAPPQPPPDSAAFAQYLAGLVNDRARLQAIATRVQECAACPMRQECSRPVPGNLEDQSAPPDVMIVGRNPGANEDRVGRGFVGNAGRRLDQWLAGHDSSGNTVHGPLVQRRTAWVTNIAHCYSTGNRAPTESEWTTCAVLHLREEIRVLQPRLILAFGAEAMMAISGFKDSIMQRAGTFVPGNEADGVVQYAQQDGERRWDPVMTAATTIMLLPHPAATFHRRETELRLQSCGRLLEQWLREHAS